MTGMSQVPRVFAPRPSRSYCVIRVTFASLGRQRWEAMRQDSRPRELWPGEKDRAFEARDLSRAAAERLAGRRNAIRFAQETQP
jgi:hypothetical protein